MRIIWHGHACFEISDGVVVVTDPHDGKSIGIRPPKVRGDLILVSHDHFDHNSVRIVKKEDSKVVTEDGTMNVLGIPIKGLMADHDEHDGEKRGKIVIYRFTVDGITFCHLGDLGSSLEDEDIQELGDIDVLFIPVGDVFTIGAEGAWDLVERLDPKVVVPMHYRTGGLTLSIKPLEPFLANAREVKRVGKEVDIIHEELPTEREVWVFDL